MHVPSPASPTRAGPEASRSSAKSKENLSVSRVLRSQDPGIPGQASPCSASQTPGPPSLRTQRHPMGSPRWDNHPNAKRPTHRASNGACLLSFPQARLCSLGFFPPSLMSFSCKPSRPLSSEKEREDAGEQGRDRGSPGDWGARREGDLTYVWVLLFKAR